MEHWNRSTKPIEHVEDYRDHKIMVKFIQMRDGKPLFRFRVNTPTGAYYQATAPESVAAAFGVARNLVDKIATADAVSA